MKKYKITITGMHCASCSGNVERSLRKVPGVKSATVSVMTRKGIVEVEDAVSVDSLKQAVTRAGYKVVNIE